MPLLDNATCKKTFRAYMRCLKKVLGARRMDADNFLVSTAAFGQVLRETRQDCEFLRERRPLRKGLSRGKIAGSLVFRLCRNHVLSFGKNVVDNPDALHVPVETALAMGLEFVKIDPNNVPDSIGRELKYYLAKRHINQEALGICFDVLSAGCIDGGANSKNTQHCASK